MKKIKANMDRYVDKLDERWQALPLRKQHKYTLYFFVGYLLLTAGVISKILYDTSNSGNNMVIEHIENPILKSKNPARLQDSLSTTLKK